MPALMASRLTPLAAKLLGPRIGSLPPDVRLHLEAAMLMAESLAERGRLQMDETGALLNRLGVGWVVLKGWPLALRLYPSPACRPSGDLDVLVASEDVPPVTAALEAIGYRIHGGDRSYHTRFIGPGQGGLANVIELHHHPGPPEFGGPVTSLVLAGRRPLDSPAGRLWIPAAPDELDLLVRHYLKHAGYQAILLLDMILAGRAAGEGPTIDHPLGSLIGDDLARLGLERTIDGERRLACQPLRRWMTRRTFEQRRSERHAALVGVPLALSRSPAAALASLARVVWPRWPTPRWVETSRTATGGFTWRLRRLLRFGR